jgi:hypothetical protein
VKEHVWLLEKQTIHRGFGAKTQEVKTLPFKDLQISLCQWVFDRVVVIDRVVKVDDASLTHLHLCVRWHGCGQHLSRQPT